MRMRCILYTHGRRACHTRWLCMQSFLEIPTKGYSFAEHDLQKSRPNNLTGFLFEFIQLITGLYTKSKPFDPSSSHDGCELWFLKQRPLLWTSPLWLHTPIVQRLWDIFCSGDESHVCIEVSGPSLSVANDSIPLLPEFATPRGSPWCTVKTFSTLINLWGFISSLILVPSHRANTKKSSLLSEEKGLPH